MKRSSKPTAELRKGSIPEDVELGGDTEVSAMGESNTRARVNAHHRKSMQNKELSAVSRLYDIGNKGFLTDLEGRMRDYDKDGTGVIERNEVLRIVQDLDRTERKATTYRRAMFIVGILSLVFLAAIFGLMIVSIRLTRLVATGGGSTEDKLVNAKTGQVLKTKAMSTRLAISRNPANFGQPENEFEDMERLLDDERDIVRNVGRNFKGFVNKTDFEAAFQDLENGNPLLLEEVDIEGVQRQPDNEDFIVKKTVELHKGDSFLNRTLDSSGSYPSYRIRGLYVKQSCDGNGELVTDCEVSHHVDCEKGNKKSAKCEIYQTIPFAPMVSGVTTSTATVWFEADADATVVTVAVSTNPDMTDAMIFPPQDGGNCGTFTAEQSEVFDLAIQKYDYTGHIKLSCLDSNTKYWYSIFFDGLEVETGFTAYFRTFPDVDDREYEKIKFSIFSDATFYKVDSGAPAYRSGGNLKNEDDPYLFAMQIGDFDHSDPESLDEMRLMHSMLRSPSRFHGKILAAHILTTMSFVHIWDDHDYCGQDTDKTCPLKNEAFQAFREYYPNYDYPSEKGFWFSFEAGHAEIFVLDTRSQRDPDILPDPQDGTSTKSMLDGDNIEDDQITWLKNGMSNSQKRWKIIVSTVSANMQARPGNIDHWMTGFRSEANMLREWIASQPGLKSESLRDEILMITGDLHSGGGIDDGCNNGFNVAELAVPHTNLAKGNEDKLGVWTEGITSGASPGFGHVIVEEEALRAQALDEDGNVRHSITLPHAVTLGCPDKDYDTTFEECSYNLHHFRAPPSEDGRCMDLEKYVTVTPPFVDEDQGELVNTVTWYECPTEGRRIMVSNDIPDHKIIRHNNHIPCETLWFVEFPLEPAVMDEGLFEPDHIMGFSLNGVVAYGPQELSSENAVELEDLTGTNITKQITDAQYWYGHNGENRIWHYHHPFLGNDNETTDLTGETHIGYAMDGFPIYGPLDDPDSVLDECNFDHTNMRYHIRRLSQVDETLPYCNGIQENVNWKYIVGCHVGNPRLTTIWDWNDTKKQDISDDCVEVTSG